MLRWSNEGLALAGLLFVGMIRRRRFNAALLGLVCLVAAVAIIGCGGSNHNSSSTGSSGTTLGNYNVTVTAMSGGASASTTIPLTVQ
jgi:hypothetical protein